LAKVARHRRLERDQLVDPLLDLDRPGIDLVVGTNDVLRTLQIAVEQDGGGPWDLSMTDEVSRASNSRTASMSSWNVLRISSISRTVP
jgi:hypothetical protein